MFRRPTLFMMAAFSLTSCQGQRVTRSLDYKLHKPQNHREYSTLHSMPDGALLVVIKQDQQPKQIWRLRRILAWDTSRPREDDLDIDVGPNNELLGWADQEDRQDRNAQLLMDPGGNYLVVRFSQSSDNSTTPPRSVLNIIDLHGFKLLRRTAVTDPPLAGGDIGFSPSGAFVVSGLRERGSAAAGGGSVTSKYILQMLTLPALKSEATCTYDIVTTSGTAPVFSTPDRNLNRNQAADKTCRPWLAQLGFLSVEDVRRNLNSFGMIEHRADYTGNIPPQAPWGCEFESLSADLKYDLLDCDERRVQVTFLSWYRGFRVFRLRDGTQIMDLKMPHSPEFSGVMATSRGVTYVVLLRNGAELEGYRILQE